MGWGVEETCGFRGGGAGVDEVVLVGSLWMWWGTVALVDEMVGVGQV